MKRKTMTWRMMKRAKKIDFNVKRNLEQDLEKKQKEELVSEAEEETLENKLNKQ